MQREESWVDVVAQVNEFSRVRDWERFHDPKNLAMAVASEAGELLALLRWMRSDEVTASALTSDIRDDLSQEMADILIFLIRLADVLDVDLLSATVSKLRLNESRFPVEGSGRG